MTIAFFLFGLALLLIGSDGVVGNAMKIAQKAKISPLVIGITLVAIGSSLPEITVSFFGDIEHATQLAVGNIIGSNITNVGLIFGLSLLFTKIYIGKKKTQKNMIVLIVVNLLFLLSVVTVGITPIVGAFFIILGFGMVWWQVAQGRQDGIDYNLKKSPSISALHLLLYFVLSLTCLLVGGKFLVDSSILIARSFHVPENIIGSTAIALGTSLPELTIAVVGLSRHATKNTERLVVGTILGSNIYNILFGIGILGFSTIKSFPNTFSILTFCLFALLFSLIIFFYKGRYVGRSIAPFLLGLYAMYLFLLFTVFLK